MMSNSENRLETMSIIMNQKALDLAAQAQQPLDAEGAAIMEHKRFAFDTSIYEIKVDPLR